MKSPTEESARPPLATESPGAQAAVIVPIEGDAHVLHVDQGGARLTTHHLDGVLVSQEVAALDGVVGVVFPVVAAIQKGRVDAALGPRSSGCERDEPC